MQENNTPKNSRKIGWEGIAVTLLCYFGIKYGIAAQFFDLQELGFLYSIILIFMCVAIGNAVQRMVDARKKEQQ